MYDFTVPSAVGHLTSLLVPAMRHLPVYLKQMLIPGGQSGFGGGGVDNAGIN